jgi:hypothetical protein
VSNRFGRRYDVPAEDLPRLMNTIVDQSTPDEARDVERLLGVLTSLSASEDESFAFVAPRGTSAIVDRALAVMERSDRHLARALRTRHRA